ncbi:MAG TPA: single-stranded DNA-binding protein [Streptosporangiaceae bacterium]
MMFNDALVVVTGYVATEPSYRTLADGVPVLSMRVGWTRRRRDSATGEWSDGNTSFVTVTCWRKLAENLSKCLRKGDPVVLRGRLDVRTYVTKEGERRIAVGDAASLGHDLNRGVANFQRTLPSAGRTAEEAAAAGASGPGDADEAAAFADLASDAEGLADDMFDERAIEELAHEADSAAAPA